MTRDEKKRLLIRQVLTGVSDVVLDQMLTLSGAVPRRYSTSPDAGPVWDAWTTIPSDDPFHDGMGE